jgi:hypothetical protein
MSGQENTLSWELISSKIELIPAKPRSAPSSHPTTPDPYKNGYYYKTSVRRVNAHQGGAEDSNESERDWQARFSSPFRFFIAYVICFNRCIRSNWDWMWCRWSGVVWLTNFRPLLTTPQHASNSTKRCLSSPRILFLLPNVTVNSSLPRDFFPTLSRFVFHRTHFELLSYLTSF